MLNDCSVDIRCVRLKPYNLDGRVLVDVQQIIPLPEAAEYTLPVSNKERQQKAAREGQPDYTKYNVTINGVLQERLSKPKVMLALVRHLISRGVAPEKIAEASTARRERILRSADRELDAPAFIAQVSERMKEQGKAFDAERYFCEPEQLIPRAVGRMHSQTSGDRLRVKPSTLC